MIRLKLPKCLEIGGSLWVLLMVASWVPDHPRNVSIAMEPYRENLEQNQCTINVKDEGKNHMVLELINSSLKN